MIRNNSSLLNLFVRGGLEPSFDILTSFVGVGLQWKYLVWQHKWFKIQTGLDSTLLQLLNRKPAMIPQKWMKAGKT